MNYEKEILELKQRLAELEKFVIQNCSQKETSENKNSNRDKTKYMFEGKVYPKNRLVLAIIKNYVELQKPTYNQLNEVFDKSLQGSLKVVETFENACAISDGSKRYFMKQEDIIVLKDNTKVVVCTQWGIFNIVRFVKLANTLGYNIEVI